MVVRGVRVLCGDRCTASCSIRGEVGDRMDGVVDMVAVGMDEAVEEDKDTMGDDDDGDGVEDEEKEGVVVHGPSLVDERSSLSVVVVMEWCCCCCWVHPSSPSRLLDHDRVL